MPSPPVMACRASGLARRASWMPPPSIRPSVRPMTARSAGSEAGVSKVLTATGASLDSSRSSYRAKPRRAACRSSALPRPGARLLRHCGLSRRFRLGHVKLPLADDEGDFALGVSNLRSIGPAIFWCSPVPRCVGRPRRRQDQGRRGDGPGAGQGGPANSPRSIPPIRRAVSIQRDRLDRPHRLGEAVALIDTPNCHRRFIPATHL